jgi:hypothetical protein
MFKREGRVMKKEEREQKNEVGFARQWKGERRFLRQGGSGCAHGARCSWTAVELTGVCEVFVMDSDSVLW